MQEEFTTEELRELIKFSKEEYNKISGHFRRVMEMYEDFEDKLIFIDKKIYEIENDIKNTDTEEKLKALITKLEISNEELQKSLKKDRRLKEADSIADLIPDI